jgi:hypothetical protein
LLQDSGSSNLNRFYTDELAALPIDEHNPTVDGREKRVVTAPSDVLARVKLGASLPHQDLPSLDNLPA